MEQPTILRAASVLGLSSSFWLSGIYFASSHLAMPMLYGYPGAVSADLWNRLYDRGVITVVPVTIFATINNGLAAYLDEEKRVGYSVAAALVFSVLPWTLGVMLDTNKQLMELAKDGAVREKVGEAAIDQLLRKWSFLNYLRTGLALAGAAVSVLTYAGEI